MSDTGGDPSLSLAERIDEACDRFERLFQAGKSPTLEEFLDADFASARSTLFEHLLHLDIEYRVRRGEHPIVAEYASRFSDLEEVVCKVFTSKTGPSQTLPQKRESPAKTPAPFAASAGFEILEELGRGGMGVVYKARQIRLNRIVAVKMILHVEHADADERRRFRVEAEAIARSNHPNIVQIFEIGEVDGRPFFAMEFCPGGSLSSRLAGTPQPADVAARILTTLARAVHSAHEHGIIHRDLKPANVLLSPRQGQSEDPPPAGADIPALSEFIVKVSDFGLAKQLNAAALTARTTTMGTPSYMAPEQAEDSRTLTARTDVYALGAILYELLTGRPPFKSTNVMETLSQVRTQEPVPPSKLQPKVPRDIETICLKCLHKEPNRRYATALDLADDLQRSLDGRPIMARPIGRLERTLKWVRRRPGAAAATGLSLFIVLAGVAGAAWAIGQIRSAKEIESQRDTARSAEAKALEQTAQAQREKKRADDIAAQLQVKSEEIRRLRADGLIPAAESAWQERDVKLARDRLAEVPVDLRFWEWHHLKRRFEGGLYTIPAHALAATSVAFSPDGKVMASAGFDGFVKLWSADEGLLLRTAPKQSAGIRSLAFSPDGRTLATGAEDGMLTMWDVDTGKIRWVIKAYPGSMSRVAFSPDGSRVATGNGRSNADDFAEITLWDAHTGKHVLAFPAHRRGVNSVQFSPDGRRLASAGVDSSVHIWDSSNGEKVHSLLGPAGGYGLVAFSPDGARILTAGRDWNAKVWDTKTGKQLRMLNTEAVFSAAFSPDGTRLAFGAEGKEGVLISVWDAQIGGNLFTYRGHRESIYCVEYSLDGQRLVSAGGDGDIKVWESRPYAELFSLPPAPRWLDTADYRLLRPATINKRLACADFSNDGRRLAIAETDARISVRDLGRGEELFKTLGPASIGTVALSEDGMLLAFGTGQVLQPGVLGEIQVWNIATGRQELSLPKQPGAVSSLAFSPDKQTLVSASGDVVRIWDAKSGRLIDSWKTGKVLAIAFRPDGKRIALGHWSIPGLATVRDTVTGRQVVAFHGHGNPVGTVSFSPDGGTLVTSGWDFTLKAWNAETGENLYSAAGHPATMRSVSFAPDGERFASCGADGNIWVWDALTGQRLLSLVGHRFAGSFAVSFSADGKRLAAGLGDAAVMLWDTSAAYREKILEGHAHSVRHFKLSPDGTKLASSDVGAVSVWDSHTGKRLFERKSDTVTSCLAFSAGSKLLAIGSMDGSLTLLDAADERRLFSVSHDMPVLGLAVSPDGKRLASASWDATKPHISGEIKVWDADTGNELFCRYSRDGFPWLVPVNTFPVGVTFSDDGTQVLAMNKLGKTMAWDAATGEAQPIPGKVSVGLAQVSANGRLLARKEGTKIRLIDLVPPEDEELAVRKRIGRLDAAWQAAAAERNEKSNNAFAAAYHLGLLLQDQPLDTGLYLRRASAFLQLGQRDEAIIHLLHASFLNPNARSTAALRLFGE